MRHRHTEHPGPWTVWWRWTLVIGLTVAVASTVLGSLTVGVLSLLSRLGLLGTPPRIALPLVLSAAVLGGSIGLVQQRLLERLVFVR